MCLQDVIVHAIAGSREVILSLPSGDLLVLCGVRYVLEFTLSFGHLKESGCHALLLEQYFTLHLGLPRIAKGASDGTSYPLHVVHT